MKTLVRLLLALFLLLVLLLAAAYFTITRPGVQKKFIKSQLPAGSTLGYVHITTSRLVLRDLDVRSPDGSRLQIGRMESGFSPLAAFFDQTVRLRGLEVEGLLVRMPAATEAVSRPVPPRDTEADTQVSPVDRKSEVPLEPAPASGAPIDVLYALGQLDWLLDIDSINLGGAIIDAHKNRYAFDLVSGPIAPGLESELRASLRLESQEALQGGLKDFSSEARLEFKQNTRGGFEYLQLVSDTSGSDASGARLLTASKKLSLEVDAFAERAKLSFSIQADLPEPGIFVPELVAMRALSLSADFSATARGSVLTLNRADLDLASEDQLMASVKLEQALTLGAQQQFTGRLMTAKLHDLPMVWINPWLGNGLELSGAPLSAQVLLLGESDGSLEVQIQQALDWGPWSLRQDGDLLLNTVTLKVAPRIRVDSEQTLHFDLSGLELADRYGPFIRGEVSGSKQASDSDSIFAGLQTTANLQIGLAELLQQPALVGKASILAGQLRLNLQIDEAAGYPARLQATISGLRTRSQPGAQQDYRLSAQLKESGGGAYSLGANFQVGSESRPSTSVQLAGQVHPEKQPLPFKLDLVSSGILQRDLEQLLAALEPTTPTTSTVATPPAPTSRPSTQPPSAPRPSPVPVVAPAWAGLDGEASLKVDRFTLTSGQVIERISAQARISEALLELRQIEAALHEGRISGTARVDYQAAHAPAYTVASKLNFRNVNPVVFSQKRSGSFPVKGLFDGDFQLEGAGASLEDAFEHSEASLLVTGREGILTAFELDDRSQLGLLGAGLLGQQLNRPGITAMSQAVPYFTNMPFDSFTLNLVRGQDKVVRIPKLSFLGESLRIEGEGLVAASRLDDVLNQPLQLSLAFGAKGRLINYLETLQLLGPQTAADGFRSWNRKINIVGTLADPDTSALKDMLNEAARRAISGREASSPASDATRTDLSEGAPTQPAERTKRDRRRDDIEMGLDLLNSLLGN